MHFKFIAFAKKKNKQMKGEIVPSREVETNNSLGQSTKQNSIPFYSCHLTGTWACCRKIRHKKCELSTVCMCACACARACVHVCVSQQLFTRIFFHILYISTKKKKGFAVISLSIALPTYTKASN